MPKIPRIPTRNIRRPRVKNLSGVANGAAVLSEHCEQRNFVMWFRKTHKPMRIFAIPNGEQRAKTTGARLKAEGVTSGVPDLFIPELLLWVEMKRTKGGAVSETQKDWIAYLNNIGHAAEVAYGCDDAIRIVTDRINKFTNSA